MNLKIEADNSYFEFNVAAQNRNLANMMIPWQDGGRLMAEVVIILIRVVMIKMYWRNDVMKCL